MLNLMSGLPGVSSPLAGGNVKLPFRGAAQSQAQPPDSGVSVQNSPSAPASTWQSWIQQPQAWIQSQNWVQQPQAWIQSQNWIPSQNWAQPQNWVQPLQAVPQALAQHANTAQMEQDLRLVNTYGAGELLTLLGPRAASVSPLLGPGYIGLDVYNQAKNAYLDNSELSRQQRIRETAVKTGDVALVHVLASMGIPLLLTKQVSRIVHYFLDKPAAPELLVKHSKLAVSAAMFGLMLVLSKPIQKFTNFVLNWTYRPLLEKKRREEVQKIWQQQLDRQMQWFQTQSLMTRWPYSMMRTTSSQPQSRAETVSLS